MKTLARQCLVSCLLLVLIIWASPSRASALSPTRARMDLCQADGTPLASPEDQAKDQWNHIGTYPVRGWLAYIGLGDWIPYHCGLHLTSGTSRYAQHGFRHVRSHAEHFEKFRQNVNATFPGTPIPQKSWQSFSDYLIAGVLVEDPPPVMDGKAWCRWALAEWHDRRSGASYVKGVKVIVQRGGGFFDGDVLGTAFPSDEGCRERTGSVLPRASGPQGVMRIECFTTVCVSDFGERGLMVGGDERPVVYLSPASGRKWRELGGADSYLGDPVSPTLCGSGATDCLTEFENGWIFERVGGVAAVGGEIGRHYMEQAGPDGLWGYPESDEFCGLRDGGCGQRFEGGIIYWSPSTGVAGVRGTILDSYASVGWENSQLGYPLGEEWGYGGGWRQKFQGGEILGTAETGTYPVVGAIYQAHDMDIGWPTGREFCGLRDGGCGQHFENGQSLYWSPNVPEAHLVKGAIREYWASLGWENSFLGYPVSDEVILWDDSTQGWAAESRFEHGSIRYIFGNGEIRLTS